MILDSFTLPHPPIIIYIYILCMYYMEDEEIIYKKKEFRNISLLFHIIILFTFTGYYIY